MCQTEVRNVCVCECLCANCLYVLLVTAFLCLNITQFCLQPGPALEKRGARPSQMVGITLSKSETKELMFRKIPLAEYWQEDL